MDEFPRAIWGFIWGAGLAATEVPYVRAETPLFGALKRGRCAHDAVVLGWHKLGK